MSVIVKAKVTLKVHGMLKQKHLPGNWAVLYDGEDGDHRPPRIELFDDRNSESPVHTIALENLKFSDKSYRQQEAFFLLSIKKEKHHFQFEDMEDKEDWVQSLCHVSQDLWKQRASARESSELDSESIANMSENLLYDSSDGVQQFKISINPNKVSEANNLQGHYMLNPMRDSLRLLEIDSGKSVHEWPYRQIRKYGSTRKIFRMEVGRQCSTGAGEFEFITPDGATLAKLIAMYTQQTFRQDHGQLQAGAETSPPIRNDDYVDSLTTRQRTSDAIAKQAPAAANPSQAAENTIDSRSRISKSSQGGSIMSWDSKQDVPKPLPRSSLSKLKKENSSTNGVSEVPPSSSETKIYETASGLTAPLDSHFKQELHSKLNVQVSATQEAQSQDPPAEIEEDPVSATSGSLENSTGITGSDETIKDTKKSEKERKRQEKEQKAAEAKRKKQLEKEQKEKEKQQKEQKEREAREEKERQKKLKKECKAKEKLKTKKSLDVPMPAPACFKDGNIYDEPGELLGGDQPAPSIPADPGYCEASDFVTGLAKPPEFAQAEAAVGDIYATPQKPKDRWKTHARPESEHIHQENYDSIRQAAQSKSQRPPIPPLMQSSQSLPSADDVEDMYNRLGDFKPSVQAPENIYGMASAKTTVQVGQEASSSVPTSAGKNEYEEASTVCAAFSPSKGAQEVRDEYEETDIPQKPASAICFPLDGDYADVSYS